MTQFKTAILVVAAVLGLAMTVSPAASQSTVETNGTDNSTVTVNVAEKTAIDISPSDLNYDGVDPGSFVNETSGDENFSSVEIENIGSTNISHVWFNASTPTSSGFGTGLASNYDAGNFIRISPQGELSSVSNSSSFFVNRREFATSNIPEYIFRPSDSWEVGRFRAADQEYFWTVNTTTDTNDNPICSTAGDAFRVGKTAHNQSATGSNDFRSGSGEFIARTPNDGDSDQSDVVVDNVNVGDRNYRLQINCDTSDSTPVFVDRTRYNVDLGADELGSITNGAAEYVLNEDATTSAALQPGEHFAVDTSVSVPQGVAQGEIDSGFLRVLVNTQ